jgi:EF-hand domain pair/COPI associated protein
MEQSLGFIGGLAMIASNGIAILDRFFSFNFAGSLLAVYGVFFGLIITILDGPGPCAQYLNRRTLFYAKFLEFTWGRGALYFFVGTLQVSNWNMLDWAVGGFMMFVGITAIGVGIATAQELRRLKASILSEADLKQKWDRHDTNHNGKLDVKELTALVTDAGIDMTRNDVAAAFLALDKNFDAYISYEEFYSWYMAEGTLVGGAATAYSV